MIRTDSKRKTNLPMKKSSTTTTIFLLPLCRSTAAVGRRQRNTDHTPLYVTCVLCHVFVDRFFVRTRVVCLASPNFNTHAFLPMNQELTVSDSYLLSRPGVHRK